MYRNQNDNNHNHYYQSNDPNSVSYYPDGEYIDTDEIKRKRRKYGLAKAAAIICCVALISVGSISAYKYVAGSDISALKEDDAQSLTENSVTDTEYSETDYQDSNQDEANASIVPDNSDSYSGNSLFELAAKDDAMSIPNIVDKVMPSVVGVSSTFEVVSSSSNSIWDYYYGGGQSSTSEVTGTGTGIIMSEDGYIVTNAHVIYDDSYGKATAVSVLLSDESQYEATIIGYDVETDLAVLKIQANNLCAAEFGDSDELQVGELVIAIGNPLGFDLFGSVTSGIVSALNREVTINDKDMTLIQTDAAINSGNSGGPLINSYGQVIGINSAKMSSNYSSATIEGLGFAIPITDAKSIIDDLVNYGVVKGRPQLGITGENITETMSRYYNVPMGIYVRFITEGGSAAQAGIQAGDIIIGIQGEAVTTTDELNKIKNKYQAGDTITLTISRNNQDMDIDVVLQEKTIDEAYNN